MRQHRLGERHSFGECAGCAGHCSKPRHGLVLDRKQLARLGDFQRLAIRIACIRKPSEPRPRMTEPQECRRLRMWMVQIGRNPVRLRRAIQRIIRLTHHACPLREPEDGVESRPAVVNRICALERFIEVSLGSGGISGVERIARLRPLDIPRKVWISGARSDRLSMLEVERRLAVSPEAEIVHDAEIDLCESLCRRVTKRLCIDEATFKYGDRFGVVTDGGQQPPSMLSDPPQRDPVAQGATDRLGARQEAPGLNVILPVGRGKCQRQQAIGFDPPQVGGTGDVSRRLDFPERRGILATSKAEQSAPTMPDARVELRRFQVRCNLLRPVDQ